MVLMPAPLGGNPVMQFTMDSAPMTMAGAGKRRKGKVEVDERGKPQNSYSVSPSSPEFMRGPMLRASKGMSQGSTRTPPSQDGGQAAGLHEYDRPWQPGKQRVVDESGVIKGRTLSKNCPQWMHAPIASNQQMLESSGLVQPEQPTTQHSVARNPQPISCDNPTWMVAPYDRIHDHMQATGMQKFHTPARGSAAGCYMKCPLLCLQAAIRQAAKAARVPKGKRTSPEMPEWLALSQGSPEYLASVASEVSSVHTTKTAGLVKTARTSKRADASESAKRLMNVSAESPPWMKSPVFSNSGHFSEMAGFLSKEVPDRPTGRKAVKCGAEQIFMSTTAVSVQSPEWMVQQARGNAVQLNGRGHAPGSGKPRRKPEGLDFKPPSRGPGSRPTPAASTVSAQSLRSR